MPHVNMEMDGTDDYLVYIERNVRVTLHVSNSV